MQKRKKSPGLNIPILDEEDPEKKLSSPKLQSCKQIISAERDPRMLFLSHEKNCGCDTYDAYELESTPFAVSKQINLLNRQM